MRLSHAVVVAAVLTAGCFHATIETGLPASSEVISKPWAHSFVYGLVPPATVETAAKCKNGAAKVETQISFLNGLVSALTWSLYTPMTITVTCASSNKMALAPTDIIKSEGDSPAAIQEALARAVLASEQTHRATFIEIR